MSATILFGFFLYWAGAAVFLALIYTVTLGQTRWDSGIFIIGHTIITGILMLSAVELGYSPPRDYSGIPAYAIGVCVLIVGTIISLTKPKEEPHATENSHRG